MRAAMIYGPGDVRLDEVEEPAVQLPTDVVVRTVASCVCGSDLWAYRGVQPTEEPRRIGHELVGVVEEVGEEVTSVKQGDFVIAPFALSDGTCLNCRNGITTSCLHGAYWARPTSTDIWLTEGRGSVRGSRWPTARW